MAWVSKALKESHENEKRYNDQMTARLQRQDQMLQRRLDALYVDKLAGEVAAEFYEQKRDEWRGQQAEVRRKIEQHRHANRTYIDEGVRVFELAQRAKALFLTQARR